MPPRNHDDAGEGRLREEVHIDQGEIDDTDFRILEVDSP